MDGIFNRLQNYYLNKFLKIQKEELCQLILRISGFVIGSASKTMCFGHMVADFKTVGSIM